jgi:hypothetical protein
MAKGGSKRGKHRSSCKDGERTLRWLESLPEVEKVILNHTRGCSHRFPPGHLRFQQAKQGGLTASLHVSYGVTNLFIGISDDNTNLLLEKIREKFPMD